MKTTTFEQSIKEKNSIFPGGSERSGNTELGRLKYHFFFAKARPK
jgi:hypothetical protein